jgi:hypothetical protein
MAIAKVTWLDDFLGIALQPGYSQSLGGSGATINMSNNPGTSGSVRLSTVGTSAGNARLRFGEEPGTGAVDVRNWNVTKSVTLEARVFFNRNTYMQGTVGFVGNPDPNFVVAAIFLETSGGSSTWLLQCANNGNSLTADSGWVHTPGTWAEFKIVTTAGTPPKVELFIDGVLKATISNSTNIPTSDLCSEFQVWNKSLSPGPYSQTAMWVDYLSLSQDR